MKFTFTTKETYLAYRSEWKAKYKELSQTIRDQKALWAEVSRVCNTIPKAEDETNAEWVSRWNAIQEELKKNPRYAYLKSKYPTYLNVNQLKKQATAMIEELKEAKQEANRQYLAAHSRELVIA